MGIVGSERVFRVLDTDNKIKDDGALEVLNVDGAISFENVWFKYKEDQWILKDLSFKIEAGKFLALVGHTGAGKSSIIRILNRFYEIDKGDIKIDDTSVNKFTLKSLRKNIALVQQEVFLFSDSILNNITLFDNSISREDVIVAAKQIGIHDFITSLPTGFDYVVGERGVTLSSGQRQLIAFLRVYIRNPKILILDEATASIDSATEALLQNALEKLSKDRTTIVIAHRLSTIVKADKILLLRDGVIEEEGNHQALLALQGEYFEMYNNQIKD
jgi:ATP-binding cassette subfamily B protein